MARWQFDRLGSLVAGRTSRPSRTFSPTESREEALSTRIDRPGEPISRIVGVYQIVLRRTLEHFFPSAQLEILGDRSIIDWDGSSDETYYRLHEDADGMGIEIEWLGSRVAFQSGNPMPLLPTERRLVEVIVEAIDLRFRGLLNQELSHRLDRFSYQTEDLIVADYLEAVSPYRVPAALEALRVAALSTYENRRVSMGALLLGTDQDPSAPERQSREGRAEFQRASDRHQGFPPALRRGADGLPRGPSGRPNPTDRRDPVGRGRAGGRADGPSLPAIIPGPRQGHAIRRARLPGPDPRPGDQGLRRGDDDVQLQRCAMAVAGHPQQVRRLVRGGGPGSVAGAGRVPCSRRRST